MKKIYILFLLGIIVLSVSAQNTEKVILLPNEDFSLMTAGSEENPDPNFFDLKLDFPEQYVHTQGWSGERCSQAGGCMFVGNFLNKCGKYESGYFDTPGMDMTTNGGRMVFKFRARSTNPGGDRIAIGISNYSTIHEVVYQDITNEWAEYHVDVVNPIPYLKRGRFEVMGLNGYTTYFDDIEVYQLPTSIARPMIVAPEALTTTSAIAKWDEVSDATGYKIDVYSLSDEPVTTPVIETSWNMDDVNYSRYDARFIDWENPNIPDGWNVKLGEGYDVELVRAGIRDDRYSEGVHFKGVKSLAFDDNYDCIITPMQTEPIRSLTFWLSNLNLIGPGANLKVEGFIGGDYFKGGVWKTIAEIDPYTIPYGGQEIDLSSKLMANTLQIRFTYNIGNLSMFKCSTAIDDINFLCGGVEKYEPVMLLDDFDTKSKETSYTVTGLEENKVYLYRVRAYNEKFVSENSEEQPLMMLTTLDVPTLRDAENITTEGFDPAWNAVKYAHNYITEVFWSHTAQQDEEYYVSKEDFNVFSEGSLENPVESSFSFQPLFDQVNRGDWRVSNALYANGFLGMANPYASQGFYSQLISPTWDLSNANGVFTVKIRCKGELGSMLSVALHHGATEEVAEDDVHPFSGEVEDVEFTFNLGNNESWLEFYSTAGEVFFDEITVSQSLKKGDVAKGMLYRRTISNQTYAHIATPDYQEGDQYYFRVRAYNHSVVMDKDKGEYVQGIFSNFSDLKAVGLVADNLITAKEENSLRVCMGIDCFDVVLNQPEMIYVYNSTGTLVAVKQGQIGLNRFELGKGMFVVKVGHITTKVLQ